MSGVIAPSPHSPDHGIAMPDEHHVQSPVSARGGTATNKPNDDNNNDNNDPAVFDLCRHMKYFLLCLRLAGLLRTCSTEDSTTTASRWRRCSLLLQMHNAVVLVLVWLNLGLVLSGFTTVTSFDGSLCNQLVTSVWFLQVALAVSNHLRQSPRLMTFLQQYSVHAKETKLAAVGPAARRMAVMIVVAYVAWLGCAFTFGAMSSLFTVTPPVFGHPGQVGVALVHVLLVMLFLDFCSAWFLLGALFVVLSALMVIAFRHHAACLKNHISCDGTFTGDVEESRRHHDTCCRLLHSADSLVRVYLLLAITTAIPLVVFTIYFVLFQSISNGQMIAVGWSVGLALLQLAVVFFAGGVVNHVAHYTVTMVYSINLATLTHAQTQQLMVLLTRLTSQPLGLSACGLFVIDKPTVITFVGTIVTYAVVVVQFRPSDSPITSSTGNVTVV